MGTVPVYKEGMTNTNTTGSLSAAFEGDPFIVVRRDGEYLGEVCSTHELVVDADGDYRVDCKWFASVLVLDADGDWEMTPIDETFPGAFEAIRAVGEHS
jgi:hypothetical protein